MYAQNTVGVNTALGEGAVPEPSVEERSSLLIIEDDPIHGSLIARVAEKIGFTSKIAGCYEDACILLDALHFDCITLDLGLGVHAGTDVLNFFSQSESRTPIVIISGLDETLCDDTIRIGRSLKTNICEVLRKPIDLRMLRETLTKIRADSRLQKLVTNTI